MPAEVPPTGILGELDAPGRRIRTAPFGIRERHGSREGTAPESAESHGGQHGERCQNPERDTAGSDPSQDARGEQCRKAEGGRSRDRENLSRNKAQGRPEQRRRRPQNEPRHEQRRQGGARRPAVGLAPHRHSRSRMAESFFSPIPDTRVKSSMDLNGPFASRSAMIFSAVAAPTPFRVSSSSAVAVLMLTRPSSPEGDRPRKPASWRMPSDRPRPRMPPDRRHATG